MNKYKILVKNTNGLWATFYESFEGNRASVDEFVQKLNDGTEIFEYKPVLMEGFEEKDVDDKPKSKLSEDDVIMNMLDASNTPEEEESEQLDFDEELDNGDESTDSIDDFASSLSYETDDNLELTNGDKNKDKEENTKWVDDEEEDRSNFPKGWHRKKEFVSKYGNVYHRGELQEELFRTLDPHDY